MLDRQTELHYYPRTLLALDGVTHALCVAPHPDDEVFGCGGLLALLARQAATVRCVVMTPGDKALGESSPAHARERVDESLQAAQVLNLPAPQFLDFEDRSLACTPALVAAVRQAIEQTFPADLATPGLLLLPSLSEPHPDHQALALAGLMAAQGWPGPLRVLFCEIGAPLHPNTYLDITAVAEQKWQAVACFRSQLGIERYESHARAFASLRAFGLAPSCEAAEAFFEVDLDTVRRAGPLAALPQWPWVRSRLQLANGPHELPLVSVLVRSMDRPSLAETLASVVQQGYPNFELVLVNATGHPHSTPDYLPAHVQWRVVNPPDQAPLGRSEAANLALAQAQGELALFLDDDDLIAPTHLQRLVQALHEQPEAAGAYSGVQVLDAQGQAVRDYDLPWSPHRLAGINFLPIHAVLFRMQPVRQQGLRFDTSLPVLEDWDFWRRLSQGRVLVHCPGVSALYRQGLGQSGLGDPAHPNHWKGWHLQLLQRYLSQASAPDTAQCLAWHALELDQSEARMDRLRALQQELQHKLQQAMADLHMQTSLAEQHLQARDQLQQELEKFSRDIQGHLAEQSAKLQTFSAESAAALAVKDAQLLEKDAQLQQLDAQLQQRDEQLQQQDAQLQSSQTRIRDLEQSLAEAQATWWWRWGQAIDRRLGRQRP